jgi:hypothetical protein
MSHTQSILERINEDIDTILATFPYKYNFSDFGDGTPNVIANGGRDMFRNGNSLFAGEWDLTASIPYTHTQLSVEPEMDSFIGLDPSEFNPDGTIQNGDGIFGAGSKYFTNLYPGLFALVANHIDITRFGVQGNIGLTGSGVITVNDFLLDIQEDLFTVFSKSVSGSPPEWDGDPASAAPLDWDDPSINHLIIVPGDHLTIQHTWDTDLVYDKDEIISDQPLFPGPRLKDWLYYLVVAKSDSRPLTLGQKTNLARAFVTAALDLHGEEHIYPSITFRVNNLNYGLDSIPADARDNIIFQRENATIWIQGIDRPLKHGDVFTVDGMKANYIKDRYIDNNNYLPVILEIVEYH